MKKPHLLTLLIFFLISACGPAQAPRDGKHVVVVESFLADIVQQVSGDRVIVDTLIPRDLDPHSFEPTPQDVVRMVESDAVVINGAGFEEWMGGILSTNLQGKLVIDASSGLSSRTPGSQETMGTHAEQGDPHFWLDPTLVIKYTENIRDGLIQMDPEGEAIYRQNAINYIDQLKRLDEWIMQQVSVIPPERRQIITNHESFGYYADRYGFTIIGTIIPSVTTGASSSPQQLSQLIDRIKSSNVKAIFLETGANSQLADQISKETGVTIIDSLFTHSITGPDGNAPSYLDMMQWDTQQIVKVLK